MLETGRNYELSGQIRETSPLKPPVHMETAVSEDVYYKLGERQNTEIVGVNSRLKYHFRP